MTSTTSADHRHPVAAEPAQRQAQRGPRLVDDALGLVAQTERAEVGAPARTVVMVVELISSVKADPRVEHGVHDVRQQVEQDHADGRRTPSTASAAGSRRSRRR